MHVKLNVLCACNISFTLITYTNTNTYIRYNTYNNITILPHSICVVLFIAHLLKFELVTMCCVQRSFQFCILLHISIDCQLFIDRLVLQSYFFFFHFDKLFSSQSTSNFSKCYFHDQFWKISMITAN